MPIDYVPYYPQSIEGQAILRVSGSGPLHVTSPVCPEKYVGMWVRGYAGKYEQRSPLTNSLPSSPPHHLGRPARCPNLVVTSPPAQGRWDRPGKITRGANPAAAAVVEKAVTIQALTMEVTAAAAAWSSAMLCPRAR